MKLDVVVETVYAAAQLIAAPDRRFGLAAATVDGRVHGAGQWREPFAIQSIAKVFALAQVIALDGDKVWARVGRRPSSRPYNAISELDTERGIPRNPLLNSGALVVVDRLLELTGGQSCHSVLDLIRAESANPALDVDPAVARAEHERAERNTAIAHLIAAYGNLHHPVDAVLTHYIWQCAIAASCHDLAQAGLLLARGGVGADGRRLLAPQDTRRINATMLTCGAYDASADIAHRVGLPLKSGVGGGILAVAPRVGTVCVWGPGLDSSGNSVSGMLALEHFASLSGWSVF
ncbi:glutaminase A [Catellatospora vulcania]|uniref:glutaminase A n=1 Tax=Catellatospora vulcania TaxID=1460450 RepID=UPI0012D3C06B|nr:glutaminase A [Catellatospora vulcania]